MIIQPSSYVWGMSETEFDAIELLEIAAAAQADPRSVKKALRGEPVRGLVGARIAREIARRRAAKAPPTGK